MLSSRFRSFSRIHELTLLIAAAGLASGCYHGSAQNVSARELTRERGWMTVDGIQLVRQKSDNECGAAALAMMLQRWSLAASSAEDILRAVPVENGQGIAAGKLRDFARQKGLQAFVIRGELADLLKELGANRPVLVGLVQRYSDRARVHYEVVAGINPTARSVLLMDPGRGLRQDGYEGFGAEWEAAGKVALVILRS